MQRIPEHPPTAPVEAGEDLAQLWRNIFPWGDLNAKLPPERWLHLGRDVLPGLAVLAAQGPDQPRLLQTDLLARLLTVGSLNAVDKAAAVSGAGTNVITVLNPNLFAPGSWVAIVPSAGSATLGNGQFYQVLGPPAGGPAGQLTVAPNLTAQVNAGDYVVGVPAVWIAGQSLNVQVGNSVNIGTLPPVQIAAAQSVNIGNTPAVTISGVPAVSINGTPSVNIASGSVSIAGTPNINIQSQSVTVGVNLPWTAQGLYTTIGAGAESFTTTAVPSGTQTLGILMDAGRTLRQVQVIGAQSGAVYLNQTSLETISSWETMSVNGARDSQFTISWQQSSGGAGGTVVRAYASAHTEPYPALGQRFEFDSLPVVWARDQPSAPWQAPMMPVFPVHQSLAAGATLVVVAAVVGKQVYVIEVNLTFDAAPPNDTFLVQDTNAKLLHAFGAGTNPFPFRGAGMATDVGVGLQILNNSTAPIFARGSALFSQA